MLDLIHITRCVPEVHEIEHFGANQGFDVVPGKVLIEAEAARDQMLAKVCREERERIDAIAHLGEQLRHLCICSDTCECRA